MSPYRDDHGFVPEPYVPPPPESSTDRLERLCRALYTETGRKPTAVRVGTNAHRALLHAASRAERLSNLPVDARSYNLATLFASSVGTITVAWDPALAGDAMVVE